MSKSGPYLYFFLCFLLVFVAVSAAAQERFSDNGDGTVTDNLMGLMWAKTDNRADIFWKEALLWIKNNFPKQIGSQYDDWRLPSVKELRSLYVESVDYTGYKTDCGHEVKMVPEIRISCILVWSSDTALGLPLAFNYNLGNPFTVDLTDHNGCRVLPVREIK
jgi:hypothetical protein